MKLSKNRVIVAVLLVTVLALVYWWGGDAPGLQGWDTAEKATKESTKESAVESNNKPDLSQAKKLESNSSELKEQLHGQEKTNHVKEWEEQSIDQHTEKDQYFTEPAPEGEPVAEEPQNAIITDKELTCTLSVRCDTILDNMDSFDPEKVELVPKDGVIFASKTVTFYEGESVFNLLLREMKKNKIHMEFVNTPMYNSGYIEGINNIYEFDCGELSGWRYKVNGWFPNYGSSRYKLKEGDKVEWVYTCNLGKDVGANND